MVGKRVDTYQILEELGSGGMGVVYKAHDAALDRIVAMKVMDSALSRGEDFIRRFRLEARALARMRNPNIVTVYALRELEFGICIIMEYVDGETLANRIAETGPLPDDDIFRFFHQSLTALHHAHREGIIHRDIKPKNIMINREHDVKITDFGLAKIKKDVTSTITAGTEGTLYYMSPEQVKGLANVDHRGDIYSLGMTLYECAAGSLPFLDVTDNYALRRMIVEGKIPSPDRINPKISKGLVRVIEKATQAEPGDRYQSAAEMLEELKLLDPNASKRSVTPWKAPAESPEGHTGGSSVPRGKLVYVIAMAMGLVLAISVWFLVDQLREPERVVPYSGRPPFGPAVVERGLVLIDSEPSGSIVRYNGDSVGVTPMAGLERDPGYANIRVSHPGYMVAETSFVLNSGQSIAVALRLNRLREAGYGALFIHSLPSGAIVWVDNARAGLTPFRSDRIPAGTHTIRVAKAEYKEWSSNNVIVGDQVQKEIHLVLDPLARSLLVLQAVPYGSIAVDGSYATTDNRSQAQVEVPAGQRTVVFDHPEFGNKEITTRVKAGQRDTIRCYFESYVDVQTLSEDNTLSWGTIILNGTHTSMTTPKQLALGPGKHTITVTRSGFSTREGVVEVNVEPQINRRRVHSVVFHLLSE